MGHQGDLAVYHEFLLLETMSNLLMVATVQHQVLHHILAVAVVVAVLRSY